MTPQQKEDALFDKWRLIRPEGICPDGVYDWTAYHEAPFKIAFVLKDAYDNTSTEKPTWSLRDKRHDHGITHTTNLMLARWIAGLNSGARISLADANTAVTDAKEEPLAIFGNMAQINIKKTYSPTAATNHRALVREATAQDNLTLLKEQWMLYKPALTLCVVPVPFWCMRTALGAPDNHTISRTSNGSEYWRAPDGSLFIGICHPAARKTVAHKYDTLMHAAREIDAMGPAFLPPPSHG